MLEIVPLTKRIARWRVPPEGKPPTPIPPFVIVGGALPSNLGGFTLPTGDRVKPGEYIVEAYRKLHRSIDGSYRQFI